jgi:hypothetical protein
VRLIPIRDKDGVFVRKVTPDAPAEILALNLAQRVGVNQLRFLRLPYRWFELPKDYWPIRRARQFGTDKQVRGWLQAFDRQSLVWQGPRR